MTVVVIVAVCIVLAVLGFLLPRLSIWPQRGVDRTLGAGQRAGSSAPGRLGRWLQKPNRALGGAIPIDLLSSDLGADQVETILGRIEYGVYS